MTINRQKLGVIYGNNFEETGCRKTGMNELIITTLCDQ